MPGQRIEKFEDLIAWEKARELTKGIYLRVPRIRLHFLERLREYRELAFIC